MGKVASEEWMYRVVSVEGGVRRVRRYRSRADAAWRASELDAHPECELVEFSQALVDWRPVPRREWS